MLYVNTLLLAIMHAEADKIITFVVEIFVSADNAPQFSK